MPFRWSLKQSLPFLVFLLILLVYAPCLTADFLNWDDDVHFLLNFSLRSLHWSSLAEIWSSTVNYTYIPLTTTTWAIEHYFFGYDPFVFHLNNILLHLTVTALVIVLSRRLGLSPFAAALAGIFFGIHPIHVESVAWVTERKDVLYGVFYMLGLLAYLQYVDFGRKKFLWLAVSLAVLSIFAKPMAVSFPLAMFVIDWFRHRKFSRMMIFEKVLCGALLMPIAFFTYLLNSHLVEPAGGSALLVWVWCFMFYLQKFLYPWPMIYFYWLPLPVSFLNPAYFISVSAFVGLLAIMWFCRRNRLLVFAFAFYVVNIFFLLRFHPVLGLVHDRFMYLASIGFCMFFAASADALLSWAQGRRLYLYGFRIALCALVVIMAVGASRQCDVWRNSVNFWSYQLHNNPKTGIWLGHFKLAGAYAEKAGKTNADVRSFDQAVALYQKAIELRPDYSDTYSKLGDVLAATGKVLDAEHYYKEAIARDHKNFGSLFKLGRIYQHRGLPELAMDFYRQAIAASPGNFKLRSDILAAYDEAIRAQDHSDAYKDEKARMSLVDDGTDRSGDIVSPGISNVP